jgi:hypothetical protein
MYTVELFCAECYAGFEAVAATREALGAAECTYCGGMLEECIPLGDGTTIATPEDLPPGEFHIEVRQPPLRSRGE